jgi:transposase
MYVAAWAGGAPGNYESAGKRPSGKTRKGHRVLRTVLVQAAHAAALTQRAVFTWCHKPVRQTDRAPCRHRALVLAGPGSPSSSCGSVR